MGAKVNVDARLIPPTRRSGRWQDSSSGKAGPRPEGSLTAGMICLPVIKCDGLRFPGTCFLRKRKLSSRPGGRRAGSPRQCGWVPPFRAAGIGPLDCAGEPQRVSERSRHEPVARVRQEMPEERRTGRRGNECYVPPRSSRRPSGPALILRARLPGQALAAPRVFPVGPNIAPIHLGSVSSAAPAGASTSGPAEASRWP